MTDLHIHSNFSDGTDDVDEILKKAEKLGITHISITDHNNCELYLDKNKHLLNDFNGEIVTGVEISTYFDGQITHVLAYDFDPKPVNKFLNKSFSNFSKKIAKEYKIISRTLKKLNIKHDKPTKKL